MGTLIETGDGREAIVEDLKRRSFRGVGVLLKRQVAVKALSFLANIALARLLAPEAFGIYAIVAFVVQFFSTFGDVGIGAALIQKKEEPCREELSSIFWLQQSLSAAVVCAAWLAAPLALRLYPSLPDYGIWLIRVLALSFALSSLKTVPAILLERRLDFGRIAAADIAETLSFYAVALSLAAAGFGAWSFIIAAAARSATGAAVIWLLCGWSPAAVFRPASLRGLVGFGLPYQGNTILGFFKDAVTPLFLGAYSGAAAVGLVNWAKSFAFAPLMLSEAYGRVSFPAFSRIQADRELLARGVERSMRGITLVMFPVTALLVAMGPELTRLVFTEKWLPAMPAFYFYCTSPLMVGISLPMYSAILALGRSGIVLKMMIALLLLEWVIGVPMVIFFGFNGMSFSQPVIAGLFFQVYRRVLLSEGVRLSVFRCVRASLFAALTAGGAAKLVMVALPLSAAKAAAAALAGLAVYGGAVWLIEKKALLELRENFLKLSGGRQ